ncbi:MAG: hypothetical protein IT523_14565 [Burkholderiales bacterium]|nr:hypothetical protein [Burkholderiales bacterium]
MRRFLSLISTVLPTCALLAAVPAAAAPGDLDTTFGSGFGKVMTAIGGTDDQGYAVALQPDGKIVIAGHCGPLPTRYEFCLARYQADGTLDTSFGTGGKVISPIGSSDDQAYAIALQPDGKIVIAGRCWNVGGYNFCLARYLANGALDLSFGTGGKVFSHVGSSFDFGYAIALQPDGKIIVAGDCLGASSITFCLARYQGGGTLDTSFGTGGTVSSPIGSGYASGRATVLQPDGKIVVAGDCDIGLHIVFCLARYQAGGALDPSFGSGGAVISPIGSSTDHATAIALQPDGKIVVAGYCAGASNLDFCLARYQANGILDSSFGTGGKVISPIGSADDQGYAIALQPDGKIVVAGFCRGTSNDDFCLARYQANGTLDLSFGTGGTVISPIGSHEDHASTIALQPDGKIVVAGACYNSGWSFCLARYQGGPFGYRNCTMDIDGDGVVLATTDALLLARTSLGMTGSAVINGISFASHATRKTWPDIRNYLVTQCGMALAP